MADEKPKEEKVEITQIATQMADVFKLPNGDITDLNGYLIWLGNQVIQIRKAVS